MQRLHCLCIAGAMTLAFSGPGHAGSWSEDQFHSIHPGEIYSANAVDRRAIYSFPVNTYPDGWAALKAEPWGDSRRMTKVYDGTLFLVVGAVPGWIAERLVGCCRPPSHRD